MFKYLTLFGFEIRSDVLARLIGIPLSLAVFGPILAKNRGIRPLDWLIVGIPSVGVGFLAGITTDSLIRDGFPDGFKYIHQARGSEGVAGVAAGLITYLILVRWIKRMRVHDFNDALAPASGLMVAFLKLGCWGVGCCWGNLYEGPLAMHFPQGTSPWTYQFRAGLIEYDATFTRGMVPTQPMEMAFALLICAVLTYLYLKKHLHGHLLYIFGASYCVSRIISEFFRDDPRRGSFGPITVTQLLSCILILFCGFMMFLVTRLKHKNVPKSACSSILTSSD